MSGRLALSLAVICFFAMNISRAQEKITIKWIYSEEGKNISRLPHTKWLKDGNLLLLDRFAPVEERRFEKFEPQSGVVTPLIGLESMRKNFATFLGVSDTLKALKWPKAIDPSGQKAVYIYKGDIFILDLESGDFSQLTESTQKEKSPLFSPDGQYLAYVDKNDLYAYDFQNRKTVRLTNDGSETTLNGTLSWVYWEEIFSRHDIAYWWSGDSKAIAFLQTDESEVDLMHYINNRTRVPKLIKQRYPKAGTKNPTVRAGIVEIESRKITWIDLSGHPHEYLVRLKWLPGDKRLSLQTLDRSQKELRLFFAERKSGKTEFIMKETDEGWINLHDDLHFTKDGKSYFWVSERDGFAHIYHYDIQGNMINRVTSGDWAVRASSGGFLLRRSIVAVDDSSQKIYFTAQKDGALQRHLYRVNFDGSGLKKLSSAAGTHGVRFSEDNKYFIDTYSALDRLPSLSCYDKSGRNVADLSLPRISLLEKYDMQYPRVLSIAATDGFPMPAELLTPKDFDASKKYPLIVYVYGGPSAPTVGNRWRSSLYFDQILLDNGYLVARIDPRSATAVSKKLENTVVRKIMSEGELNDLVAGVKWFKSQSYVDAARVGVWGWSGGGSFTLNAMTGCREFAAGISVAPVTDWHFYDTKWTEYSMKLPSENADGYHSTSLVKKAANLHGRLLLVHGTYDDNVHPQNSWRFIDELITAGIQFDMMFYPMRKHGIRDDAARIHLYTKMLEFWQRNL